MQIKNKLIKFSATSGLIISMVAMNVPAAFAALTFGATTTTTDGAYTLDGVVGSVYTIGGSTTTGTITVGGTSQTGTITLGSSDGTNIVAIGAGAGATTVNVAGGTAANNVNIGIGATGVKTIAIGTG